jgi:acyl-CoA thioesterase I
MIASCMRLAALLLALLIAFGGWPAALARAPELCPLPEGFRERPPVLGSFANAVRKGGPVPVLAVGSASTNAAGASFPRMMQEALQIALPHAEIHLSIRGRRGLTAAEMVPLIAEGLAATHAKLVLWQTGTVDAVQGVRPEELTDALEQGAELAHQAGADLILIDPQFSRFLHANTDLGPYEQALQDAATQPGVTLFPRFDLMRDWAEQGTLDIENTPQDQRPRAAGLMHACVGHALAAYILAGIEASSPPELQDAGRTR